MTAASALGYLEWFQEGALDRLFGLRGAQRQPLDVAIVAIDDAAFAGLGHRQPISRAYLARLVRGLQRSGAAVVGLDVTLGSATDVDEDRALAGAIADFADDAGSRVVLAEPGAPPSGPLADPALTVRVLRGAPEVLPDSDGAVRRVEFVLQRGPSREPSFALAVAARRAGLDAPGLAALMATTPVLIPASVSGARRAASARPGEPWPVNFVGPSRTVLTLPSDRIAEIGDAGTEAATDKPDDVLKLGRELLSKELRGRVVLVGGTFDESRDFVWTPHGKMPGVEVHASAVHMLISGKLIRPTGWRVALGVQVAVALAAGLVFLFLRPLPATIVCMVGALAVGVPASFVAFDRAGYWVDFVLPVLATCLMGFASDVLARRRFRSAFRRYVSREVMAKIEREGPELDAERREVSILFSDLRGFTALSEAMPAEVVAAHLNEYFEAMKAAIFPHHGMINNFIGDAVMAIFGAPFDDPEHAAHAVQAAVDMDASLRRLNRRWQAQGFPALRMGIGIHSGVVFAGNIGARERMSYTVIGDPVNVAARLESLNKELDTTVLLTEETRRALGTRFDLKDRGSIHVKGREQLVHVYEVILADGEAHT